MYNKDLKVIDCTIRDGGLINKWQFSKETVRKVFLGLEAAGVDYMEIGYRASKKLFPPGEYGLWRFCEDEVIAEIVGDTKPKMRLGVMVDIGRVNPEDIAPVDQSPLSFIRVATYLKDIDKAILLANEVADKGYEALINIMAISSVNAFELVDALKQVSSEKQVCGVTVVDSNGALYPSQIRELVKLFGEHLGDKATGFHAHNNLQLAFANSIEALSCGTKYCDATVFGIGRGAGNCPLELLLAHLRNPRYNIEPLLDVIQGTMLGLREEIEWGYIIPYMITGILNEHPRVAIELRGGDRKDEYAQFYRELTTPECLNKPKKA